MDFFSFLAGVLITLVLFPVISILIVSLVRSTLGGSYMSGLQDKYVLITGCDSGFGYLAAQQLDKLGCHVVATCLTQNGVDKLRSSLSSRSHVLIMDVTNQASIKAAEENVKCILPDPSALWGLVNNAGITNCLELFDFENIESMKKVVEVNLWGTVGVIKAFLPHLRKSRGRVVNIASIASRLAIPFFGTYSISKFGVAALTDSLRVEMAAFGVSFHLLEPGAFKTPLITSESMKVAAAKKWEKAPAEIKQEYDRLWFTEKMGFYEQLETRCTKLSKVTDCIEHALFSTSPKHRYFPGTDAAFFLWWLALLPAEVTDVVLGPSLRGRKGTLS